MFLGDDRSVGLELNAPRMLCRSVKHQQGLHFFFSYRVFVFSATVVCPLMICRDDDFFALAFVPSRARVRSCGLPTASGAPPIPLAAQDQ